MQVVKALEMVHLQLLLSVFFAPLLLHAQADAASCRCLPKQPCWPDAKTWQALNASLEGALIAAKPLASPCHDPHYDESACRLVKESWSDAFWRADQPAALQGPNMEMDGEQGCLLTDDRSSTCSQGALPMYVVDVSKVSQVQKAVSFASHHNLRLVIKNTGHELTGRNTASGSLSIWMHHLKSINFSDSYVPSECGESFEKEEDPWLRWLPWAQRCQAQKGTPVVKVGAGVQWEELYQAAHEHKKTVVGAQCVSVGAAGGYPQGGGHSQISPSFGLAADNVLEFEVVKADGKVAVANSCRNKDLFWALRGGGGGTFGVVTSVTYAAHPALTSLPFASYVITTAAKATPSTFKDLLTRFISLTPSLSDSGWGGFFIVASNTLIVQLLLPNRDVNFAQKTLQPLVSYVGERKNELVIVNGNVQGFNTYYEWHRATQCGSDGKCGYPSGYGLLEASRLIPRTVVEEAAGELSGALIKLQQSGYQRVSGYLVGGGKVSRSQEKTAVNPAWRKALLHVLFVKPVADNCTSQMRQSFAAELTSANKALYDLTPGSGSYMNEADRNDPLWKEAFFGSNYEALRKIKAKHDPKGLFVCNHCVGSEDWSSDLNCRAGDYKE